MVEIWQRYHASEMQKADEIVPASANNQKPKTFRDGSSVVGRRISRRRFGELLELVQDRTWLAKVTNALNQYWQKRNAHKKSCFLNNSENGRVAPIEQP